VDSQNAQICSAAALIVIETRSAHNAGSWIQLPRVFLTVCDDAVHQPGRTAPVMSVRAALTRRPTGPPYPSPLIQLFFRDARRRSASFLHAQAAAG
jgi:hypothetical protein